MPTLPVYQHVIVLVPSWDVSHNDVSLKLLCSQLWHRFFPVGRIQYLFSLGLALQHHVVCCRNLILLIIYFLVGSSYSAPYQYVWIVVGDTCAGSTIKIVFHTCLSKKFLYLQTIEIENLANIRMPRVTQDGKKAHQKLIFLHFFPSPKWSLEKTFCFMMANATRGF